MLGNMEFLRILFWTSAQVFVKENTNSVAIDQSICFVVFTEDSRGIKPSMDAIVETLCKLHYCDVTELKHKSFPVCLVGRKNNLI